MKYILIILVFIGYGCSGEMVSSSLNIAVCKPELIDSLKNGRVVRQQAVIAGNSIYFTVLDIQFEEPLNRQSSRYFGGDKSVTKMLVDQTKKPQGPMFSWSFVITVDTTVSGKDLNTVVNGLLSSGVPSYCIIQMPELDLKVKQGYRGILYPKD